MYYLVDTNGALSQVLAEYDENSSLTTLYTRGEGLISQERNGEKSYYLYDGFDSVRMLADSEGVITDTYTFDAFGNLVSSTGDTENSYLYRGEQYDSFTGLYYLRARYMNPTTGTFISMDEYAGSVFEPVSLHKYLYANANPVMNADPSGYSTLSEMATVCAIGTILGGICNTGITLLRFFFDDSYSLEPYGGNLALAVLNSFVQGAWGGFIFSGFGYIAAHSVLVSMVMVGFCGYSAYQNYTSAWFKMHNGNMGGGIIDSTLGASCVLGAFSFLYSAYARFCNWAASRNTGSIKGNTASLIQDEQAAISELLARGDDVEIIPATTSGKTPDFYVNGKRTELKTLNGTSSNTAVTRIQDGFKQNAEHVIIDATKTELTLDEANCIINRASKSYSTQTLPGTVEIWTNYGTVWG